MKNKAFATMIVTAATLFAAGCGTDGSNSNSNSTGQSGTVISGAATGARGSTTSESDGGSGIGEGHAATGEAGG